MSTEILTEGLCFGEGPRWHNDELWISDMHAHQVLAIDAAGQSRSVVEIPNRPSGLGWLPSGELLIVSMTDAKVLKFDGQNIQVHSDLGTLTQYQCNDMVVDAVGRAYVGNFGFDLHNNEAPKTTSLICIEPDGSARIATQGLTFPNGTVITPDGKTLIVAETFGRQLTAFDVDFNGDLSNRRCWAELPDKAVPDGICLDEAGGIWSASPTTNDCIRQTEGGEVTHRITLDQGAYACMLGGPNRKTLYILTASSADPATCIAERSGRIETAPAPFAGTGLP